MTRGIPSFIHGGQEQDSSRFARETNLEEINPSELNFSCLGTQPKTY